MPKQEIPQFQKSAENAGRNEKGNYATEINLIPDDIAEDQLPPRNPKRKWKSVEDVADPSAIPSLDETLSRETIQGEELGKSLDQLGENTLPKYTIPVIEQHEGVASVHLEEGFDKEYAHPEEILAAHMDGQQPFTSTQKLANAVDIPQQEVERQRLSKILSQKPDREDNPQKKYRDNKKTLSESKTERQNRGFLRRFFSRKP